MRTRTSRRSSMIGARVPWVAVALAVLATAPRAQVLDRVLAIVNGEVVTSLDVRAAVVFQLVEQQRIAAGEPAVLEALIDRQLMIADASRYSVREPEEAEIERGVQTIRSRFPSPQAFETAAATTGMTEGRLRTFVGDSIRLDLHVEQRFAAAAQPTDDEVTRYYREHSSELARGGVTPPLDQVRDAVTAGATAERRAGLVSEWLQRLRQRAEIRRLGDTIRR